MSIAPLPSPLPSALPSARPVPAPRPAVVRPLAPRRRSWQPPDSPTERPRYAQSALALSYPLPEGTQAMPEPRALAIVPDIRPADPREATHAWAATFVQAVIEVIASDRPMTQLVRWTTRPVYVDIAGRREAVARTRTTAGARPGRQQVATVRVCQPEAGCAEVTARLTCGMRSQALAARLDHVKGRWLCTAICFG